MTNHKDNPAEIYLVPMLDDDHDHIWCEDPAPGEGMREEDATRYVRADLVPASNEVLANSIAELTRKNSELQAQVSEQSKVIDHIAKAVGEEADPMACWESVDALVAQVEQLRQHINKNYKPRMVDTGSGWAEVGSSDPKLFKIANQLRQQAKAGE